MELQNRYEFLFYIECVNGNPNGDPDMGNSPRIDPQDMHGYITDVAVKRRIRNYVQTAYANEKGMRIIMQSATNINKLIAEAHEKTDGETSKGKNKVNAAREYACANFFDVRTFGAVLSTGLNAGQIRGPVQLTFAKSVEPILPLDISITRMLVAENIKGATTVADYEKWESEQDEDKLRTIGRKQFITYGLYEARGFISANLANETGFDEKDMKILFESILNMYEHDRSASKGHMSVISPIIIFKHVGTDNNSEQRIRQAKLGCAAAHKLFDLVNIRKKDDIELARNYKDFLVSVDINNVPKGVDIGFLSDPYGEICWGKSESDWVYNV
jgi:CRISPR-associated protein Csd2